jgi:hypothetical protein
LRRAWDTLIPLLIKTIAQIHDYSEFYLVNYREAKHLQAMRLHSPLIEV